MKKIIIICGPTAVGKTQVGIELAKKFNGEIISADSQQVWRGFDIGTAKARVNSLSPLGEWEYDEVPHHLIDVADPTEHFDAARFMKLADDAIADIASRGKVPFVVGGTGMFLRMLEKGLCDAPPQDPEFREELDGRIEKDGIWALHSELNEIDPKSARDIHPNDRTRIERALEIYHLTGKRASEFREEHGFKEKRYDALKIGLTIDREELYRKINERVDLMMNEGLLDEVRSLLEKYDAKSEPFQAVGYRELVAHIKGEIDLEEALRLTKRNSRRFAKRQLTWFKSDSEIAWFDPEDISGITKKMEVFL